MDAFALSSLCQSPEKTDEVGKFVQTNSFAFGKGTQLGIHKLDKTHDDWISTGFLPNMQSYEKTLVGYFAASLRLLRGDKYC